MDVDTLLAGLDDSQREAVTTPAQPLCILAGAGSGKTRVLTRRIAHRTLTGDIDPRRVLALTFTRRAAGELTSRLRAFGLRDVPSAGTFHATAYAQLRDRWVTVGERPPTLLDRKGRVLARILGGARRLTPMDLAAEIEWAKARLVPPSRYAEEADRSQRATPVPHLRIAELYCRYEEEKRTRRLVDFDDLLTQCAAAIESDPAFAAAQRWRWRHLFVDEYQDVNPAQEKLLQAWLGDRPDLCVVGDPDQAIYRWNGADASYLIGFGRRHPEGRVVELRDNYRSTPEVLAVAASVLGGGGDRRRPMRAHVHAGPVPTVLEFESDAGEAAGIARAIRDGHGPGVPWSAQAVLVRTNAQTALIEEALRRVGIPYRIRGGRALLDEPDVRQMLQGFARSNEPFVTTLADLRAALVSDAEPPDPDSAEGRRQAAFDTVVRLGDEFLVLDRHAPTSAFPAWLTASVQNESPDTGADAVTLASFHAAKGLEWSVVHLAGLEDGFCPITHARDPEALAEERRLLYVAVTRAEQSLHLTWAQRRTFGEREVTRSASPYLRDVLAATQSLGDANRAAPAPLDAIAGTRSRLGSGRSATPGSPLLESLRGWRAEVARAARVAPTVVLPDRTLAAVASRRPADRAALDDVPGMGPIKVEQYGPTLLALVAEHPTAGPTET